MAWTKVGSLAKLPENSLMEATVEDRQYVVCNVAGTVYALDGACPHHGGPLGQGALNGGNVTCPWHAWEFDCRTGVHDYNQSVRVPTFRVQIAGGDILIDIP